MISCPKVPTVTQEPLIVLQSRSEKNDQLDEMLIQELCMKRGGTMNERCDLKEICVLTEMYAQKGILVMKESIHVLPIVTIYGRASATTVGLHQNILRGDVMRDERKYIHQSVEIQSDHLAEMQLLRLKLHPSILRELLSFRAAKNPGLECRSVVRLRSELGPHDLLLQGAMRSANMVLERNVKIVQIGGRKLKTGLSTHYHPRLLAQGLVHHQVHHERLVHLKIVRRSICRMVDSSKTTLIVLLFVRIVMSKLSHHQDQELEVQIRNLEMLGMLKLHHRLVHQHQLDNHLQDLADTVAITHSKNRLFLLSHQATMLVQFILIEWSISRRSNSLVHYAHLQYKHLLHPDLAMLHLQGLLLLRPTHVAHHLVHKPKEVEEVADIPWQQ